MTTACNQDPVWTQQLGGLTGIVGRVPAHRTLKSQPFVNSQAARCDTSRYPACPRKCMAGEGSSSGGRRHEQELSRRQFFLDPKTWWDYKRDKKSSPSSDFRRQAFGEVLWLNNLYKSAWVDEQLPGLDMQMGRGSSTSKSSSLPDMPDPGRPAGHEMGVAAVSMSMTCQQGKLHDAVEGLAGDESASNGGCQEEQELLWRQLFRDPTMWWDNRRDKKSPRSPDFRCKGSGEVLWVNNKYKPSWVDEQLVALDIQVGRGGPTTKSSLREKPDSSGPALYETGVTAGTVSTLCQQGKLSEGVGALEVLARTDCPISKSLFYAVLKQCVAKKDLVLGRCVHSLTVKRGYGSDTFLSNHILRMYASHGRLQEAMDVFTLVCKPDVYTWTAIISAHVKHGLAKQAIQLYHQMRRLSVKPSGHVFVAALQACARGADLETGQQVHADVLASGLEHDLFVVNCLVDMYAKCGSLKEAQSLFERLPQKDVVTWNTMIAGYAKGGSLQDAQSLFDRLPRKNVVTWNAMIAGYSQQGMGQEAIHLYSLMQEEGITAPDSVTFVCLLQACARVGTMALQKGKQLHAQIGKRGLEDDVVVGNSLVSMYAKCGSLNDARSVFDRLPARDVVTWNTMIAGYSQQGMGQEALHLHSAMQKEGIAAPDSVTFVCLLQACASVAALHVGKQLHAQIQELGLEADVVVGNSLVNMYGKCGSLEDAQSVFDRLPEKNVVTWTAMIAGYSQQGMGQEALHLYSAMQKEGIAAPDTVTFVCLLQACASLAALPLGKQLHAQIVERGLQGDLVVGNNLVNMYAKCGSMVDAQQVFDGLSERDIVAWGSLIAGYTFQGDSEVVFSLVKGMTEDDIQPDSVTFLSVLTVCSHVGLVNKGQEYFEAMTRKYEITPSLDHYTCMVDLLGRAGQLEEALEVVRTMPGQPNDVVWSILLGACRKWSNVELGRHAFDELVKLDEKAAAAYVMMSNIYQRALMWEEAEEIQARRIKIGAWKQPGESCWTDPSGRVHSFLVGDKKHPESEGVYARLEQLVPKMKNEGYVPHLDSSLRGTSEEEFTDTRSEGLPVYQGSVKSVHSSKADMAAPRLSATHLTQIPMISALT